MHALQLVEEFKHQQDAMNAMDALRDQDGYLGGRILALKGLHPGFRVQAFFVDSGEISWLPDGVRRVFIPLSQRVALGLN